MIPPPVLAFEGGPRVDARRPPSPDEREAMAALALGPAFAVLAAEEAAVSPSESPDEVDAQARDRVRRTLRLEELLARAAVPFRRVEVTSHDGLRLGAAVAVALPRAEAEALARRLDLALLCWYDGERFHRGAALADLAAGAQPPA